MDSCSAPRSVAHGFIPLSPDFCFWSNLRMELTVGCPVHSVLYETLHYGVDGSWFIINRRFWSSFRVPNICYIQNLEITEAIFNAKNCYTKWVGKMVHLDLALECTCKNTDIFRIKRHQRKIFAVITKQLQITMISNLQC